MMKSGDIVMKKLRWSYDSLRLGLLTEKTGNDVWTVLWTMNGVYSLERCFEDDVIVITDENTKEAEARWKITRETLFFAKVET